MGEVSKPYRRLNTWQTVGVSIGALLIGLALIYYAGDPDRFANRPGLKSLLNALGGTLCVSVAFGTILNLMGKRALTREVFETARLSTDMEKSGLRRIGMDYTTDPEWQEYFTAAKRLDLFFAYGRTWRNLNLTRLQALAGTKGSEINVYVPDVDDELTCHILTTRFNMTPEDLRAAVRETREAYLGMRVDGGATISVFKRPGDHTYSCYRFDTVAVVALYKHKKARGNVPTLVFNKGGTLFDFVNEELAAIHEQSNRAEEGDAA
jgi:hypothetical protein